MFTDVGAVDEFEEARPRVFTVSGRQVGVVMWHGEAFALRNVCPHEYGPVCGGFTMPMIVGDEIGTMEIDEDRLVVICPWHGWEFDARSGRAAWRDDSTYRLKTYPTKIEDGRVLVDVGRAALPQGTAANAPGHADPVA
jgi:nitrite reductase/ring-hydroxylating ferredoxin subunit